MVLIPAPCKPKSCIVSILQTKARAAASMVVARGEGVSLAGRNLILVALYVMTHLGVIIVV